MDHTTTYWISWAARQVHLRFGPDSPRLRGTGPFFEDQRTANRIKRVGTHFHFKQGLSHLRCRGTGPTLPTQNQSQNERHWALGRFQNHDFLMEVLDQRCRTCGSSTFKFEQNYVISKPSRYTLHIWRSNCSVRQLNGWWCKASATMQSIVPLSQKTLRSSEIIDWMLAARSVRRHPFNCITNSARQAPALCSTKSPDGVSGLSVLIGIFMRHVCMCMLVVKRVATWHTWPSKMKV